MAAMLETSLDAVVADVNCVAAGKCVPTVTIRINAYGNVLLL